MESFYLIIVVCLIVLAVSDLVVGVSNDAVNFLNSALGSKVASRRTILIVATIGIALGAMSSSGMMEIARKGIFNPEMFTFADIMVIFLAVMVTDILLLDLFNTFGMPTSTTVSIMFELLGAAFAVACLNIISSGDSFGTLGAYLNTDNAILIIAGIFLSVLIAFTIGMFVQYITRLIFSFNLTVSLKRFGALFGGIAITTITYFLLIKGMKGSALLAKDTSAWIKSNTPILLLGVGAFWSVICWGLNRLLKVNILKLVVLAGTFALAMAFAGNDLVNFIGVPLAGLQSYEIFQSSGVPATELGMAVLGEKVQTNTLILFGAGLIMILTLWFSKKAESVTETEINLARSSEGSERFKSNMLARLVVRGGLRFNQFSTRVLPNSIQAKINRQFSKLTTDKAAQTPAFDLLRASVNLMVASILIAFATSLKLPLSTTYVSFMVAMGTSLADRAWSRDSAVYRVSGVINVITGWLFTALIASVSAAVLAVTIYFGGIFAVVGLMGITVFLIVRSHVLHQKIEQKKQTPLKELMGRDGIKSREVFRESELRISNTLFKVSYILKDTIKGLSSEEKKVVLKAKKEVVSYQKEYEDLAASFYYYLKKIDSEGVNEGQFYLHVLNYLQNISQAVDLICKSVFDHVANFHQPLQVDKRNELEGLTDRLSELFIKISDLMGEDRSGNLKSIKAESNAILDQIHMLERRHITRIKNDGSSPKNSMLYIAILLECRDILINFTGLVDVYESSQASPPVKPIDQVPVLN